MGRGRSATGETWDLWRTVQRTLFSPNASRSMGQNPQEMGQAGTRRFRGDVPETPGNGTAWDMAAAEGLMWRWKGPTKGTARTENALVLGLVVIGLLRVTRRETGLSPETGKSAGPGVDGVCAGGSRELWRCNSCNRRWVLGSGRDVLPGRFAERSPCRSPSNGVVSMSGGCTEICSLIPTCSFARGRRRTGGQKGNGPRIGGRFFGPPCSGRKFPPVPKWEVGREPRFAVLMSLSDGAIGVIRARSAECYGCSQRLRFKAGIEL